jgi:small-conductance mechanosensitive channel
MQSPISLSVIMACCAIAIGALVFLLALTEVMSKGDAWDAHRATTLRIICVPFIAVFCAFFAYVVTKFI